MHLTHIRYVIILTKKAGTHCELKQTKSLYFKIIVLPPYVPYEIQTNYREDLSNI